MRRSWLLLLVLATLIVGCNASPTGVPPVPASVQPLPSRSAQPSLQPSPVAPQSPLSTLAPVSPLATRAVGDTMVASAIPNPTSAAGITAPTVAVAAAAAPSGATAAATPVPVDATPAVVPVGTALPGARVTDGRVNARSGPGTAYAIVAKLEPRQAFPVTGQIDNCAWLQISLPGGDTAWVSGDPNLVELLVPCASVARAAAVPTLQAKQARPTAPAAQALPTVAIPQVPVGQGCYVFENLQEVEESVQLTSANGEINISVTVSPGGQNSLCVTPGQYKYTITPGAAGGSTQDRGTTELRARQSYRWLLPGPPQ